MSKIKKELYERENQEIIEHTKFQIWVGGGWYPNGNVQWRVDYESVCVRENLPVPHLTLAGVAAKLANAIV